MEFNYNNPLEDKETKKYLIVVVMFTYNLSRQLKLSTEFRCLLAESCSRRFLFVFNFQSFPRGQSPFSHWGPQSTPLLFNLHGQPSTFETGFLST